MKDPECQATLFRLKTNCQEICFCNTSVLSAAASDICVFKKQTASHGGEAASQNPVLVCHFPKNIITGQKQPKHHCFTMVQDIVLDRDPNVMKGQTSSAVYEVAFSII